MQDIQIGDIFEKFREVIPINIWNSPVMKFYCSREYLMNTVLAVACVGFALECLGLFGGERDI